MTTSTIPQEYVCPLTKKMMNDPVVTRYGTHYERSAIMDWLADGNKMCPVTGNPLRVSNIVSDKSLKWKIDYWAKKNGIEVLELDDDHAVAVYSSTVTAAIPEKHFLCPLTREIMEDPVMTKTGHNFERAALSKWLDENGDICPMTKKPLTASQIVSNPNLKWEISQWQLYYGDMTTEMSKLELDMKLTKAQMMSKEYHVSDILHALTGDAISEEEKDGKAKEITKAWANQGAPDVLDLLDDVLEAVEA
mmetsp:Transcript_38611/g.93348  ORF Transcript_38611/g.93348 Transcript_38611/m.93348 type:complete len:249 (-) Transcript_38611:109-855(-)|eukprot:CAMPEP_0113625484 /NCGR_PEP_ID=MMETSP0017_2-20120614/13166_1 /TAXON_ID=2856 /ORGANISM="Cylindrotheca closterium" /LENGTH=248 /DNA_ID=CAMNT_0000535605 /DNA_START=129 /DNA_END=875 /DNA_ORIENTATION=- /assembly_acc=CAM_ASM_000147